MKRTLLNSVLMAGMLAVGANVWADKAPVYIETDMTSQFSSLTNWNNWTGASGYATWAAPQVTTNAGATVYMCEKYEGTSESTGDVFYQTVSGLTAGTYKIELYGSAAFTFGRGIGSGYFTDDDTPEEPLTANTGVKLYAQTSVGTIEQEIAIYKATTFSSVSTAELIGVEVGEEGSIKIGMSKSTNYSNWHIVQLKGVTAQVNAVTLYANLMSEAATLKRAPMNADALEALNNAMVDDTDFTTAAQYQEAIDKLSAALAAAKTSVDAYAPLNTLFDEFFTMMDSAIDHGVPSSMLTIADEYAENMYDGAYADSEIPEIMEKVKAIAVSVEKQQTKAGATLNFTVKNADWTCEQGNGPGWYQNIYHETYIGSLPGGVAGKVMYQKIEGLLPGATYQVTFLGVANSCWIGSASGDGIAQIYANNVAEDIPVIEQGACTPTDYERTLTAEVGEDGVFEYGIQNIAEGANWYVLDAISLKLTAEPVIDGIEAVSANQAADAIFNLQGQRVEQAQKGLYIVNGKKMLVK